MKDPFKIVRIGYVDRDSMSFQFSREGLKLRSGGNENNLRSQCNYSFNARLERVTNRLDLLRLGWIVAIRGSADQTIAGADRINYLGQIWRQRNESGDCVRDGDCSTGLVSSLVKPNLVISLVREL